MSSAPSAVRSFIRVAPSRYVDDRHDDDDDEHVGMEDAAPSDIDLNNAVTSDEYFDPPTPPLPIPLASTPSYVSRLHRPPPIELPKHKDATAATAAAADTTPNAPPTDAQLNSDLLQAEIIWREERIRSVYAHTAHAATCQLTHSASIALFIVNQALAVVQIVFASVWAHQVGVIFGATAFIFGLAGSVVWYRQTLDSEHSFVVFTVRPIYAALRAAVLVLLVTLILIHVLHFDPAGTTYPAQCDYEYNCARVGGNATAVGPLKAFSGAMSIAQARTAVLDIVAAAPRTTLFVAQPSTDDTPSVIIVRARVISYWLGAPSDLIIQIQCAPHHDGNAVAVVWMQSQSRLSIGDNGENLRRIDDVTSALQARSASVASTACT